jgi:anaerobic ribonucleoside-triphosphate reductase activating protein
VTHLLNVNSWLKRSVANGPGERFVLWVQGCPLDCPGCFNPDTHPFTPARMILVEDMARQILSVPGIEGVTYSGGEPMCQAAALAQLSTILRGRGLTIMCYTGYTLAHLRRDGDPAVQALLAQVDILVDGRFRQSEVTNRRWSSSRNQKVHFVTGAYRKEDYVPRNGCSETEFIVGSEGFATTGIWPADLLKRLESALREEIE